MIILYYTMFLNTHPFNNASRIGLDATDNSQRNLSNSRYADYTTENHFSSKNSTSHVKFATSAPTVNFRGAIGAGLPGDIVDKDSELLIKSEQQRPFEKLQLNQRPYATVPYLGRGSNNAAIESQLQQGQQVAERKSTSTVMESQFIDYNNYPLTKKVSDRVNNPAYSIEESALDGWVRGGLPSREIHNDSKFSKM
jgi:hypothetical protein